MRIARVTLATCSPAAPSRRLPLLPRSISAAPLTLSSLASISPRLLALFLCLPICLRASRRLPSSNNAAVFSSYSYLAAYRCLNNADINNAAAL